MDTTREMLWLRRVRDLSHLLAREQEVRKLLPLILDAAIELSAAERGFLVRVRGRRPGGGFKFKIEVARGFDRASLSGSTGDVSRTVVRRVVESGERGLVTTRETDSDVLTVSSVADKRVLAIVCVPMRLRGETHGVLYLDHRFNEQAFSEEDLALLGTFADQAALAMETAELISTSTSEREQLGQSLRQIEQLKADLDTGDVVEEELARPRVRFGGLIGGSPAMCRLYEHIERAARTWDPVLILGESGTGKELVAKEIHDRGSFPGEPFLSENCAAVTETLLESELFGHRKSSFTGATSDRAGLFTMAGQGTLLLDEVGDMSAGMQGKLLRVLQEGTVRPVGGDRPLEVSARILAATHRDLRAMVDEHTFREDLYYRLDVLRITVPALRNRPEDIPILFDHFAEQSGGKRLRLTAKARDLLVAYTWPGNVRELENEARRLAALDPPRVKASLLSPEIQEGRGVARASGTFAGRTLGEVEREMVETAMRECKGNKSRAARQLGIPRTTLYHLLERYDLA